MFKSNNFSHVVSIAIVTFSITSQANESDDNSQSTLDNNLEIIEVYAQKRAQDISDVSVAVTVIEGDAIEHWQLKDSTQLASLVPNVKITNNAGEGTPPAFNIRGVGMIDYNTSTISPIAVYSDGVVSGSANNLSVSLFDVDHVEVLRGPQGTLFGRNTTGGAILLMSKMPTDNFEGYVNASFAEHNHSAFNAALNVPLTESTKVRFAINHEDYNFSTNNLHPGAPDGGLKQTNLRLIAVTDLDDFTITTKLHSENWSGKPKPIASLGVNRVDGSELPCTPAQAGSSLCMDNFGGQVGGDDFWDVRADTADREHDTDSWGATIKLSWQFSPSITLNSLTAYNDLTRFHSWDSDGAGTIKGLIIPDVTIMNLIEGSMGTENSLFSQEFSIAVQNDNSYWISGLFYVNEKISQENDIDLFRDFRGIIPDPAQFFYHNQIENTSIALYSQFDHQLSEQFTLTAGLRYTDETTDYHAIADLDTFEFVIPTFWDVPGEVKDDELSWKLALNHKLNQFSSVYYSYSRGYKSGGYNAGYTTSEEQAIDSEYAPEKLNAYEIGSKLQFWQRNASLNLAAFYYDYQDQQVFVNRTTGIAPYHVLKNAGDSTIYGLEAEFFVIPTDNIQVSFNLGYIPKANIGTFVDGEVIVAETRLPFSSKWNVSGSFLYENELFGHAFTSQLGFDYQSDFYFDQNENPDTEQTAFIVWNGRMTYHLSEQLRLMLWGKNLTNTEHSELRFDSVAALGAITELKAQARQVGVELAYNF